MKERKEYCRRVGDGLDTTPYPTRPRVVALAIGQAVTAPRREGASGTVNLSLADILVPNFATIPRKERSDGQKTREAILAAASAEFAEKGFALGSMRAICANAGVNSALASRYFGSKEGLYKVVAKRLFGDLGAPLAQLARGVTTAAEWKAALREWIDDFLFMTIPTEKAQKLCAGLFRHEVVSPTKFHAEFKRDFGKPVYDALRDLLAMALDDENAIELWASSVWAQVSVYALADKKWHASFQPKGVKPADWRAKVGEHIAEVVFASLKFKKGGK